MQKQSKTCSMCKGEYNLEDFSKNGKYIRSLCKICKRIKDRLYDLRYKSTARGKASRRKYHNSEKHKEKVKKRKQAVFQATPKWLTPNEVTFLNTITKMANQLGLHVDHVIPIQNKDVCGLNVPWNLQILTPHQNSRKGNKWNP